MTTIAPEQASNAAPENPVHELPALDLSASGISALDADLYGGTKPAATATPAAEEKPTETPTETVAPVADQPTATAEPVKDATGETPTEAPVEDKPAKVLPNRINTEQFDDVEKEAIALAKHLKDAGEPVPSLKERIELVERRRAASNTERVSEPEAPQPRESEAIAAQLKEIDDKLEAAGEAESTITPETVALIKERSDLAAKLALAQQSDQRQADQARATHQDARKTARSEAIEIYPSAEQKGSPLANRIAQVISEARNPNHPNHSILLAADAPLLVAHEAARLEAKVIAAEKKIPVAQAMASLMAQPPAETPAPPAPPKQETTTTKKIQPAGATAPTPPPAPAETELGDPREWNPKAAETEFRTQRPGRSRYVLGV